jgi:hypothetical protein
MQTFLTFVFINFFTLRLESQQKIIHCYLYKFASRLFFKRIKLAMSQRNKVKYKYNPERTFEQEDADERLMNDGLCINTLIYKVNK